MPASSWTRPDGAGQLLDQVETAPVHVTLAITGVPQRLGVKQLALAEEGHAEKPGSRVYGDEEHCLRALLLQCGATAVLLSHNPAQYHLTNRRRRRNSPNPL